MDFNGETLTITLDGGIDGVLSMDWIDIYSAWKDWMLASPLNRGYPEAFRTAGGDPVTALLNAGAYWFLRNDYGWRIKPAEEDLTIYVSGNLAAQDIDLPIFIPTIGGYTVGILGLQPIAQGVSSGLVEEIWSDVSALIIKKMVYNKVTKLNDIVTIYEDDGIAIWKQFDLSGDGRVEV